VKAVPLWEEIQAKVRDIILQPDLMATVLKQRLDNGEAISRLELEMKDVQIKLATLAKAEQRALRLHLFFDSDERDSESLNLLLAEEERIKMQRKEFSQRGAELATKIEYLMGASVDAEGIRRFLLNASTNLESWDESRWRILLEALNLKITAHDDRIDVEISVPSQGEGESVTAYSTSQCGHKPIPAVSASTGNTGPPAVWRTVPRPEAPSSA
jgi:hypothetical protein